MSRFDWLAEELEELRAVGLARDPGDSGLREELEGIAKALGGEFVDASSNDYLGYAARGIPGETGGGVGEFVSEASLAQNGLGVAVAGAREPRGPHVVSRETLNPSISPSNSAPFPRHFGVPAPMLHQQGSGASRLLGGTRSEHVELERLVADWVGQDEALLFSSGYAANLGLLSSLPQRGDTVFSDAFNHASIIDGCRLNDAATAIYPHLDLDALRTLLRNRRTTGHSYIVTESYFSMDADSPNLPALREIADEQGAALIVDEAHALGIFGPRGAGLSAQNGVRPDIVVGTLGKAVGLQGAFVAAPLPVRSWLWNRARSFVYSTAPTPTLARRTQLHVKHVQQNDLARTRLLDRAEQVRSAVAALDLPVPPFSHGPIIPILLGSVDRAIQAAQALRARGILAYPIRPPTVPTGSARIRLTINTAMSDAAFAHLLDSLSKCLPC
jgi:8-amino-7-oxononanoate synthase